jgi:hypothetical protein
MTSLIDPTKPTGPVAYTADVRANFAVAKSEIEELQARQQVPAAIGENVLQYGAVGDGVTNDTNAIQNCLNAFAGTATIFIPDTGNPYMVSGLLVLGGTDLLIQGTLKAMPGSANLLDIKAGNNNITIHGHGTLDGNAASATCISADASANISISDLTLQNPADWNLNVTASNHVRVNNVRLIGGNDANEFALGCDDCWITNSYIHGPSGDIAFSFYGGVTNSGITNCEVCYGGPGGIAVYADGTGGTAAPCSNIVISNNIVHHHMWGGILVSSGVSTIHSNISITGNRCYNNCFTGNNWYADISITAGKNVTITGNDVNNIGSGNAGSCGIEVGALSSYVTITGNSIWNIGVGSNLGGTGITLNHAPHVSCVGNHIYDSQTTPTTLIAFGGATGPNNVIVGNRIDSSVSSGLGLGTSACVLAPDTVVANAINGVWTVGAPIGGDVHSAISAGAGWHATTAYLINGLQRWFVGTDGSAESGSNTGSNFAINSVNDAGNALIAAPFRINRDNGLVSINDLLMSDTTAPLIQYVGAGLGTPSYTTRSPGNKIVLYPSLTGSAVDYAIGITGNELWVSVPQPIAACAFMVFAGPTPVMNMNGAGSLTVSGNYTVNGTPVVGPQIAGWGTPTGGARAANFNGASATLVQTSAALAGLITDLRTHGLLGA